MAWRASRNTRRICATGAPTATRSRASCASGAAPCWSTRAADLRFPRVRWPIAEAVRRAREFGVSFAGVTNSHHFGVAAWHLRPVADAGMVGLAFGNSPAAMPAAGGRRALFGTNPIAAVFPRRDRRPD